ncbi:uncharacterized protein LOC143283474 [Babylonia areolata]|uniref:uncharacterized protein LOC143283474 n=1 Tax=Babylonia areolata TaxID=304850 RepID=UPI003FD35932
MKILAQVYTGSVRPDMEYASNAWVTAAKSSTEPLAKIHNASLRLITGGMKTTPINAMAGTAGLMPSIRPIANACLTGTNLLNPCKTDDWSLDVPPTVPDIPGIQSKDQFLDAELKLLTVDALDRDYPSTTWIRVYTDGFAENAVKNRGCGVYIRFPDGSSVRHSIATGLTSTNFRAEASALLAAAQLLNQRDSLPDHTVFLTDCRAVLQSLQTRVGDKTLRDIQSEMQALSARTTTVLQWIPSHYGIAGNEETPCLLPVGLAGGKQYLSVGIAQQGYRALRELVSGQKDNVPELRRDNYILDKRTMV